MKSWARSESRRRKIKVKNLSREGCELLPSNATDLSAAEISVSVTHSLRDSPQRYQMGIDSAPGRREVIGPKTNPYHNDLLHPNDLLPREIQP